MVLKLKYTQVMGISPLKNHANVTEQMIPATAGNAAAVKRESSTSGMAPMLADDVRAGGVNSRHAW